VRRRAPLLLAATLVLHTANADAGTVKAEDYRDYWLWAGVTHRPEVETARSVYLLQGEIGPNDDGAVRVKAQGGSQPGPHAPALWLVYRVRSLNWPPAVLASITRRLSLWRAHPGVVEGVQIDFDASTRGIGGYAAFLREMKASLPAGCKLSVTGLMDWASQAEPEDLDELSGTVDELIFQTYRGRRTVADIDAYLKRLDRLRVPFRLGLVEGGDWTPSANVEHNPYFHGYVVFLRNPD
jgi:hypothetical protein